MDEGGAYKKKMSTTAKITKKYHVKSYFGRRKTGQCRLEDNWKDQTSS